MRGRYVKPPPCGKYEPSVGRETRQIPSSMWFKLGLRGWKLTKEELDAILQ